MRYNTIFTRMLDLSLIFAMHLDKMKEMYSMGIAPQDGGGKQSSKEARPRHDLPKFDIPEGGLLWHAQIVTVQG